MKNDMYKIVFCLSAFFMFQACTYDYMEVKLPPPPPKATAELEAKFVQGGARQLEHSYWKQADFLSVNLEDISRDLLYGDGYLNMTGTIEGLLSFNKGNGADLTLKAAYDAEYLYILAEWTDHELSPAKKKWLWDGPSDPLKTDVTDGWTTQRNDDQIAFAFEIENAISGGKTFSIDGCAASCHQQNDRYVMFPESGKVDIWHWDLGTSAPFGYARDLFADASGFSNDDGTSMFQRNISGTTPRSGPAYEWNGDQQLITTSDGKQAIIDPAFYLINKQAFEGDIQKGKLLFQNNCFDCHGEGGWAPSLHTQRLNRMSRKAIDDFSSSASHTGEQYYNKLSDDQVTDLIAFLRGMSGVPGYYLTKPEGSTADIQAISNVSFARIDQTSNTSYKVLLIRKLVTGNNDDVQFEVGKDYVFGIALMDADGKNHIGSMKETLKLIPR